MPVMRALTMTKISTGLFIVIFVCLAGANAGEKADPMLAEMGAPYFERYCSSCHGVSGRGDGPVAELLSPRPADLTRIAARRDGKFPDGEVAKFIDGRFDMSAHGSRDMPVWGDRLSENVPDAGVGESMTRGKIAVLVEYLKSIQVDANAP
jgi:mono/diheme cytochrome c family protein